MTPTDPIPRARTPDDCRLAARLLDRLREGRDVRAPAVRRLRRVVRSKQFENDLKLAVAAERMLADL